MFFSIISNPNYQNCYTTERPYTDPDEQQHSNNLSIFVPTVLSDLAQIVDYCLKGNYPDRYTRPYQEKQRDIHLKTRDLCKSQNILGEESRWDAFVDQQLKLLEDFYNTQQDPFILLDLAYKQLISGSKIIKKVMYEEHKACLNNQTLFWRMSNHGHTSDIERSINQNEKVSFGDSLFSGYIWDGMFHSDINVSYGNYSACIYNYYDVHKQGRKIFNDGYATFLEEKISINELPQNYQNYLNRLDTHELYSIKFDNNELAHIYNYNSNEVYVPNNTISSSACYQQGEEFHPSIQFSNEIAGEYTATSSYLTEFNE